LLKKGENIMNTTALTTYRPSLLGRNVFEDIFDSMLDFPALLNRTTQGYPVADIYRDDNGDTVMEFALAGFSKDDLTVEIKPEKNTITVSAGHSVDPDITSSRRIARRSFSKTYVNYDNNLNLADASADFENGLLRLIVPVRPEVKPLVIDIK
jgi:HSP20 family molecular chaperone IbpA|tara:strand:- start:411 stop:869 length:459 start_codon:yes stop_codon:yes gene_type:complete